MSPDLAYQAYKMARLTVAKTRQIVMLYDGAIRYIQQAQQAIRDRKIEERYERLTKAGEILSGLRDSIDFEKGGGVATALYDYYGALDRRLNWIQLHNDAAACDEVIARLKEMRDAWNKIDEESSSSDAPSASSAAATAPVSTAAPSVTISA